MKSSTRRLVIFAMLFVVCWLGRADDVLCQEFRVYTRIYDLSKSEKEPVARTMSLFHHGMVYGYIDGVGEVTVFDPVKRRFVVMNGKLLISTIVEFDELTQWIKLAKQRTKEEAETLRLLKDEESVEAMKFLEFLMNPEFDIKQEEDELWMNSDVIKYQVKTISPKSSEAAETYLRYADWIKRMNSMMNPAGLLPGARLALNDELRKLKSIPSEVRLTVKSKETLKLKAVHQVYWSFGGRDRQDIERWKKRIKHPDMQQMSMKEYLTAIR